MACDLDGLNILLVDDEKSMRMLVRDVLLAFGFENVRMAPDAPSAYRMLDDFLADIVILDWQMAPMNGLDLLRQIRTAEDSPDPYVPVIMLTAHTELNRVIECRLAGATSVLAKPIAPRTLYRRIERIVEDGYITRSSIYFLPEAAKSGTAAGKSKKQHPALRQMR